MTSHSAVIVYPLCSILNLNTIKKSQFHTCVFLLEGSVSVLALLRAQLRKAEHFRLLKMLVIGPPRQGKTALLEVLQTGKAAPFTTAECSISTSTWELDNPNGGKNVRKQD